MLFVVIGRIGQGSGEKRQLHRPEHLKRLEDLQSRGKLKLAGPFSDISGSLIIFDMESLEEVEETMKNDPYTRNGVYESYEIKPFTQVLPK